jgi:gliding motility-associated-like protein
LGRISFIAILFTLSAFQLSAQSGYSNLEFVENKGQWDTSLVKFRAEMSMGTIFMQKTGFTVLLQDTSDLKRIHSILHGDQPGAMAVSGGASVSKAAANLNAVAVTTAAPPGFAPPGNGGGTARNPTGTAPSLENSLVLHSHSYRVSFVNANEGVKIVPDKPLRSYNNYFIGDRSHWASNCKTFQGVIYQDIYPGIDLHYYTDAGFLKYDIIVHPGADPGRIALKYEGQTKLSVRNKQVQIKTTVGTVRELEPRSYQVSQAGRTELECNYVITGGNTIHFDIKGYSPDATLVIDPTEVFCSFTGSRSDNWGYTATYDNAGNFYAGGIVLDYADLMGEILPESGSNFLTTPGAFQSSFQGGDGSEGGPPPGYDYDVGIKKFSSDGHTILFATYLGGTGDEQPHSMICDPQGNLIVTGRTSSPNFPTLPATATTYQGKGFDIFVTKFNVNGTGLIGSQRFGGTGDDGVNNSPKYLNAFGGGAQDLRLNYGDDGRSEVILDASNNIYVAGCTQSLDFPIKNGFQNNFGGGMQDGVLLKLSPDVSTLLFSSYLGGAGNDAAFVLALSPTNNNIYVAGGTMSTDFPGTAHPGVLNAANQGGIDGFVSMISNDGGTLLKTTYFGTSQTDMIYGLDFDKEGFPYIMGTSNGVIPTVNSPFNQTSQASGKQFITKLQPDLSGIVYSANFGPAGTTTPNISPTAFLVDRCENVYVAGWGGGVEQTDHYANSTTTGLTTTAGALKPTTDGSDFYFFVLQKNAASQLYGSFFGQNGGGFGDHVDGGTSRFDKQGIIYEAICANCYGGAVFPTTPGSAYPTNGTGTQGCNEAAVKVAFNFAGVSAGLKLALQGRGDSVGCVPLTVGLQDTVLNAKSYIWDFGDGNRDTTTIFSLNHIYTRVGTFQVMLIAIDSNSCNVADTVYKDITVSNNPAFLNFNITKEPPCLSYNYLFNNESTHSAGSPAFTDTSFVWNFGDASAPVPAGPGVSLHSYASPGPYNVSLILVDTNYCNSPDTLSQLLNVAQNVKAQFITPPFGCAPYSAVFNNTSLAGQTYYWYFGDGTVDSTDRTPPPHLYSDTGSYTIELIVVDSNTCNIRDTAFFTISVQLKPTAAFTFEPSPPVANTPTVFTNSSLGGIKYQWLFGDGSSEFKATMDTAVHQYNTTTTYQACLVVFNQYGCTDTVCHGVPVIVNPLLDVPNAFTPGRFGENAIVKVVGFGISHLIFRIYNRWGQLVFESNDPNHGWDGTFRGTLQPMDVYAYTVEAQFSDGTHATKKGDITLIR